MRTSDQSFVQSFIPARIFTAILQHGLRMKCDSDEWVPNPAEVEHLSLFGLEQHVIVAIGSTDNIELWKIGKAAGFSGGTTTDEAKRRANWASAASKATRHRKKILPHIAALKDQLERFRTDGGGPQSVSWKEKLDRCEWLIRHGEPSESMRAIDMHNRMNGMGDSSPEAPKLVAATVARVGVEKARIGIEALAPGLLWLVAEVDPAAVQASEVQALNVADKDFNSRSRASE